MKPSLIHFAADRSPVVLFVLHHLAHKNVVTVKGTSPCLRLPDKYCPHNANTLCFVIQLFEIRFQSKNHTRGKRNLNENMKINNNNNKINERKPVISKLQFRIVIFFS